MSKTVTSPHCNNIWTETLDHVLSLIRFFSGRAGLCSSSTLEEKTGLRAMSLLLALSIVCGLVLHVSFSALSTQYCVPRRTVPYQSKSQVLTASTLRHDILRLCCSSVFTPGVDRQTPDVVEVCECI